MSYFIATTNKHVSKAAAKRINERIQEIDDEAEFVRHYAAGNETHGWIERPNDGTNDYNHVRERNARMAEIMEKEVSK